MLRRGRISSFANASRGLPYQGVPSMSILWPITLAPYPDDFNLNKKKIDETSNIVIILAVEK